VSPGKSMKESLKGFSAAELHSAGHGLSPELEPRLHVLRVVTGARDLPVGNGSC